MGSVDGIAADRAQGLRGIRSPVTVGPMKRPLLILCLLAWFGCPPATEEGPTAEALIAKAKSAIDAVKSYEARLEITAYSEVFAGRGGTKTSTQPLARLETRIQTALPDRMRVTTQGSKGSPSASMVFEVLFDGQVQWVGGSNEASGGAMVYSARADQKKLAQKGPFDSGYEVRGVGLVVGQDLIGTWRHQLSRYAFSGRGRAVEVGGEPCWEMDGKRADEERIQELEGQAAELIAQAADDEARARAAGQIAALIGAERTITVAFSKRDGFPRRWVYGPSAAQPVLSVTVAAWKLDPTLAPSVFAAPAGTEKIADLTGAIESKRKNRQGILANNALVDQTRKLVAAALARESAGGAPAP